MQSPNPNTGTYWYLMIVMFEQARPIFLAFIHTHLTIHSLTITLRCWIREEMSCIIIISLLFMGEPEPSAVIWPTILALLFMYPIWLYQMRLGILGLITIHMAWALQTYVIDLWLTWDIANATIAFNTIVVPYVGIVLILASMLVSDYNFSKTIMATNQNTEKEKNNA
eukprot:Blabericola_migrator_1__480@NODE_1116_length_5384_cov_77_319541_g763_i0_p4_GENE_NODE_1116_length_5384_cov_77_319541_g763_i0NODE_1116_length_5384_cov_77_319541_g763_i0_p4_ORF_typecomplete_len168_score11_16PIGU/PF06728_13/4_7e14Sec62/PF03839_16/1_4_NODE_1116_length_5384_cov_77_319541_g763_i031853688